VTSLGGGVFLAAGFFAAGRLAGGFPVAARFFPGAFALADFLVDLEAMLIP